MHHLPINTDDEIIARSSVQVRTEVTITLCYVCSGSGVRTWQELVDYHRNDYESRSEPCKTCSAKGMIKTTVKVPYVETHYSLVFRESVGFTPDIKVQDGAK